MFHWVIEKQLARGGRPKSGKNWTRQVSKNTVDRWIKKARTGYAIRSIICLIDQNSLRFYEQLPAGLLDYYRANGLEVEHIPIRLQRRLFSARQLKAVWQAFQRLPKPVLVHCSAGRNRSRKSASYIKRRVRLSGKVRTKSMDRKQ